MQRSGTKTSGRGLVTSQSGKAAVSQSLDKACANMAALAGAGLGNRSPSVPEPKRKPEKPKKEKTVEEQQKAAIQKTIKEYLAYTFELVVILESACLLAF